MHKKPSILSRLAGYIPLLGRGSSEIAPQKAEKRKKKAKGGSRARWPYRPGELGLSAVSTAIKKDFGAVLNRKERKQYAKAHGVPFKVYYNH